MKTQAQFIDQLVKEQQDITSLVNQWCSTDSANLYHRPQAGAWHCLDCIQHLNQTLEFYLPRIEAAINQYQGSKINASTIYRPAFLGGKFAAMQEPKNGKRRFKAQTFKSMRPQTAELTAPQIAEAFTQYQNRLIASMQASKELPMNKIKVVSAIGPLLRFQIGDLFAFITAHHQRHMLQAQEALGDLKETTNIS